MSPLTDEQRALVGLKLVSGIGARILASMLERFGSAQAALRATRQELQDLPYVGETTAAQFREQMDKLDIDAELRRLDEHDVHLLFLGDVDYPQALAEIPVPPALLYVRGTVLPGDGRAIAIVGSRSCTAYGRKMAERLAADLARAGWTIISGLARGIDGAAHAAALKAGGRTLAVLANGLSRVYPPEHEDLAREVCRSGALITEAHMRMEPMAQLFPGRNRVISGLSQAVVIVEADHKSGALITATHAGEQGREVFAVPGPADSPASAGPLRLIRDGARLVRSADDILEDLEGIAPVYRQEALPGLPAGAEEEGPPPGPPPGLDETQGKVWELLEQSRHQDELAQSLDIPAAKLSGLLMMLEMKKVIRRLPGNYFERC